MGTFLFVKISHKKGRKTPKTVIMKNSHYIITKQDFVGQQLYFLIVSSVPWNNKSLKSKSKTSIFRFCYDS